MISIYSGWKTNWIIFAPKSNNMKKTILALIFIALNTISYAQNITDDLEVIRDLAATEYRALVAENMAMNEEESKVFWPIYDEYRAEVKKIGSRRIELLQKFADNYESMTDETARQLMNEFFQMQSDYTKLRITYKDKMLKSMNAQMVFRYFQIENKIDALISISLAQEVPLILKK